MKRECPVEKAASWKFFNLQGHLPKAIENLDSESVIQSFQTLRLDQPISLKVTFSGEARTH